MNMRSFEQQQAMQVAGLYEARRDVMVRRDVGAGGLAGGCALEYVDLSSGVAV
jgi:hypothetical protein